MKLETLALVFPGQGSQKIGMGKDLYNNYAVAKEIFTAANIAATYTLK